VRPGVRKIKAILDELWASAKKAKTISKSYVYDLLKKFEKYPEEVKNEEPKEFARPLQPGKCFCIDTATCYIGDKTQVYFQPVFDEFNSELIALVGGAERGIRTIKYDYLNQVWIGNLSDFNMLSEVIKLHYNEYRPHQSFDNKTPLA
jgi:hypothetical protein